ncbi:MAG: hypothetical protein ACLRNQ_19030 [Flavonifractor plautii]
MEGGHHPLSGDAPFPAHGAVSRRAARAGQGGVFPVGPAGGPAPVPPPQPEPEEPPEDGDKVLEFPGEEGPASDNPIAEGLNRLFQKADDYAGHMFEEEGKEDDEEVRRAEEYIPGTDEEEPEEVFRERRPRRQPPPAPDLPAAELARRYGKGLKSMGVRSVLVFLLLLPALYLTLGLFPYPAVLTPELRVLALAGIQGAAMLLGLDVLMRGLFRLLRLELGMDTLLVFAAAATLADALTMYRLDPRDGQMPYCAAIVLGIFFLLRGARRKRRGLRMACRTAASAAQPYLVTLDEGKWNGWDTYAKWSGSPSASVARCRPPTGRSGSSTGSARCCSSRAFCSVWWPPSAGARRNGCSGACPPCSPPAPPCPGRCASPCRG